MFEKLQIDPVKRSTVDGMELNVGHGLLRLTNANNKDCFVIMQFSKEQIVALRIPRREWSFISYCSENWRPLLKFSILSTPFPISPQKCMASHAQVSVAAPLRRQESFRMFVLRRLVTLTVLTGLSHLFLIIDPQVLKWLNLELIIWTFPPFLLSSIKLLNS